MSNIWQTYRHQQLQNSYTPEQLRIIDKELACIRQARRIALEQGGDPQNPSGGSVGERYYPNFGTGDQQRVGSDTVDDQDQGTGANDLQTPTTEEGTQNPTNKRTNGRMSYCPSYFNYNYHGKQYLQQY
jgi:hypothetical protein